jgi:peptidoglycan/LPS O-acetylase OafA/YrhL
MFVIMVNVCAFFFGAELLERSDYSLLAVAAFVVTALVATIAATLIDVYVRSLFSPARRNHSLRAPREMGLARKPLPATSGQTR